MNRQRKILTTITYNEMGIIIDTKSEELDLSAEPKTFTVIDTKTGKEADTYKIASKEEWAKGLCYCDMEGFAIEEDGTLILLDECGRYAYCPKERFEVEWDG